MSDVCFDKEDPRVGRPVVAKVNEENRRVNSSGSNPKKLCKLPGFALKHLLVPFF